MTLTIIALDHRENFLQFIDPDLVTLEETISYGGIRTLKFNYLFQKYNEDKKLFKIGNKIWIQGDNNLSDCLYVINTQVEQDIYNKNEFTIELEEILVELNYAPLFSQTELTTNNGFNIQTKNGKQEVIVDDNNGTSRQSNRRSNPEAALTFEFLNSIKSFIITHCKIIAYIFFHVIKFRLYIIYKIRNLISIF